MSKKRPRSPRRTPAQAAPRVRAHNERRRRTSRTPQWLFAIGGAAAAFALGWWMWQGFVKAPSLEGRPSGEQTIAVGAQAPSLALPATSGGQLSLDDLRGSKVVVYFYEGVG